MPPSGSGNAPDAVRAEEAWPTPRDGETEILLLGMDHIANREQLDVLGPERQRQLRELVERLADWNPDAVAVELPRDRQDDVDGLYVEYRHGERAYDEATDFEPLSVYSEDNHREYASEPIQVGFRLADHRDLDTVHAVDDPMTLDAHLDEEETAALDAETLFEGLQSAFDVPLTDGPDLGARWPDATVVEFLRWLHREEHLRSEEQRQSAMALARPGTPGVGARIRTAWYERNLRILENVWRAVGGDADRVVLVVGYSHVHILRHLLRDAPPLCPVDPRPLLADG
jgi:hypothetical protein